MANVIIVGTQWGDEGKGKLVDILTEFAHGIVRFQGGSNAGHTVVIGENKFIFHQLPSGILHDHKTCVIGSGVVVDPATLVEEIEEIKQTKTKQRLESEMGDLLFAVVNLIRWNGFNAESTLRMANEKFRKRFEYIEKSIAAKGKSMSDFSLSEMDKLWEQAKNDPCRSA